LGDHLLARLGVGELGLELGDVLVLLVERLGKLGELGLFARQRLGHARLGDQRALRQILAPARHGKLGAALPFLLLAAQRLDPPLQFLALGNGPDRRRAHLYEGILHLLHDQPDDLLRILGAVEDGVDVRIHDVGKPEKCHGRLASVPSHASL